MNTTSPFLPRTIVWMARALKVAGASWRLRSDPILFAKWYAITGAIVQWPEEAKAIIASEQSKKIGLDRMATLIQKLGFTSSSGVGAERAKLWLEGYALHAWVQDHWHELGELTMKEAISLEKTISNSIQDVSSYSMRVEAICHALELSPVQQEILEFAFMCGVGDDLADFMHSLAQTMRGVGDMWSTIFNTTSEELTRALAQDGALRRSGFLEKHRYSSVVRVDPFWVELLCEPGGALSSLVIEPLVPKKSSGYPAVLTQEDMDLASSVLKASTSSTKGVNLLLYGATHLDKHFMLKELLTHSGKEAWHVKADERVPREVRHTLTYLGFCLLKEHEHVLLVVERPGDVLQQNYGNMFKMLFGLDLEPEDEDGVDKAFLAQFTTPGLWLMSDVTRLPSDTVARFVFHAPLKKADRNQRLVQMQQLLDSSRIGKNAKTQILKLEGISALQIEAAMFAAKLAGHTKGKPREEAIVQAIKRSQKALGRDLTEKFRAPVTQYSMSFLNCGGRFGPEQIMEALKNKRRGTLVFYGKPGTGKTQFVEYMATELGIPLIAKRASDLMGKYVGENEKNIAAMFEEATNEDAMLLLDEGDSFLRDRSFARSQWEVTMVNELLQQMEKFTGIFVVCTNLFEGLDAAALRRFTFKLEFNPLNCEQRWDMFVNETGLKGKLSTLTATQKETWWEALAFMRDLTSGDFATVQRQCQLLNMTLTPDEWITQLTQEVKVKRVPSREPMLD